MCPSEEPEQCDGRAAPDRSLGAPRALTRRRLLGLGAGAAALAGAAAALGGAAGLEAVGASSTKREPIATTARIPVGSAYAVVDSLSGVPAYALQPTEGHFVAFPRICPHLGCTVNFAGTKFVCPCHGSESAAATGALLHGPAERGLTVLPVAASGGEVYLGRT